MAEDIPARILVCDTIAKEGLAKLAEAGEVVVSTGLKGDDLCRAASDATAIVVRSSTRITAEVIETAPRLRIVGRAGVGVDNIDVDAASARGIIVVNSPEDNTRAAAEHAVALLLALTRSIPEGDARMRRHSWSRNDLLGNEVRGKVIGLIGLGRVGSEVARMAGGLGMKVIAQDVALSDERCRDLGVEPKGLDELLRESDYVSVHVPLTDSTRGLIGEREIGLMKPTCRIVNSSRGGVVDEAALAYALTEKRIGGAACDVYESEPEPPWDSPLLSAPATVLTPHLGASTAEAQVGAAMDVAEQIVDVLNGLPPRSAVNLPMIAPESIRAMSPWLPLAERMGLLISHLAKGGLRSARLTYSGGLSGYDCTLATRRFLVGLMRRVMGPSVNDVNVPLILAERGVTVAEVKQERHHAFHSHVQAVVECDDATSVVEGSLRGFEQPRIVSINGYTVDMEPFGTILLVVSADRPGVIGKVGTILGAKGINIAQMNVGRSEDGAAQLMLLNLDGEVPPGLAEELVADAQLSTARIVTLPPAPPGLGSL